MPTCTTNLIELQISIQLLAFGVIGKLAIAQRRVVMANEQAQEKNLLKRNMMECVVVILLDRKRVTIKSAQVDSFDRRIICIVSYMKFMILKILDFNILLFCQIKSFIQLIASGLSGQPGFALRRVEKELGLLLVQQKLQQTMMVRNVQGVSQGLGDVMIKTAKVSCFLDSLKGVLPV